MAVTLDPVETPPRRLRAVEIVFALLAGSLLTFMLLFNSTMAAYSTPLFSSLAAHGVGTMVAGLVLVGLWRWRAVPVAGRGRAPLWAYLGGLSGALTVPATSIAANSSLALTGTLALGIAGQVVLALLFDAFGALGLVRRLPSLRDLAALVAILAGTGLIIAARGFGA